MGCTSQFAQSRENLDSRLQARLKPDIAGGRVALDQVPDGSRVTLVSSSLYTPDGTDLDDKGRDALTALIQALLDPQLLAIEVAAAPPAPEAPQPQSPGAPQPLATPPAAGAAQSARAQAVARYFEDAGLKPVVQPELVPQQTPPPPPEAEPPASAPQPRKIIVRVIPG